MNIFKNRWGKGVVGIPKGSIIAIQGSPVEAFRLDVNRDGKKPLDTISRVDILKGVFFSIIPATYWNHLLHIETQMTTEKGEIITGGTATREYYLEDGDMDWDTKFWIASCLMKYYKRGFSQEMDERLGDAIEFFDSYEDEELKVKLSLLM